MRETDPHAPQYESYCTCTGLLDTLVACTSTSFRAKLNTQIPVDADAFLIWLGDKLRDMGQVPVDNGRRMDASRELVNTAIEYLDLLSEDDRDEVFDVIINSSETGMIGEYRIPYDDRDHYDWIEGILATLEGYLED